MVNTWFLLTGAILSEVAGSLSLKAALDHPAWFLVTAIGFLVAFVFLTAVLRTGFPLGVAYGIWGASGVGLTALLSALIFAEPLTPLMMAGIVLIILGVLTVQIGSQQAHSKKSAAA